MSDYLKERNATAEKWVNNAEVSNFKQATTTASRSLLW